MKLAAIFSRTESDWRSCQVITPNLLKTYQKAFPKADIQLFNFSTNQTLFEKKELILSLKKFSPDKLLIIDHKPFPEQVIRGILEENFQKLPECYFHLFGDFSLYSFDWFNLSLYLKKFKVKFIVASESQKKFVSQFVNDPNLFVEILPFPVDENDFEFNEKNVEIYKKELNLESKKSFLYTGRISAQKNILQLIKTFVKYLETTGTEAVLNIAGEFDDLGYPFFGIYHPQGFQFALIESYLSSLSKEVSGKINFLGNLGSASLLKYYHASDYFVSFSVHNDEDYGMSPAEALICGLPVILTNWGGYNSFQISEKFSFAPVEMVDGFYTVRSKDAYKMLLKNASSSFSLSERKELSLTAKNKFGIESNSKKLKEIHAKEIKSFDGWNLKFKKFSQCFKNGLDNPFSYTDINLIENDEGELERRRITKKIYRECYDAYIT